MSRPASTYRAARRNDCRRRKMIWSIYCQRFNVAAIRAAVKAQRKRGKL